MRKFSRPNKGVMALAASIMLLTGLQGCSKNVGPADWTSSSTGTGEQVKLSGTVQSAPKGTSFKPGKSFFGKSVSGVELEGTALANVLVLVTDALGNTNTDTAGKDGGFDMDLESGKAYAVIFIDTKTMKVIGSLVQAANTDEPAAFSFDGDVTLGNVVIDTATGKAVAQADATPDAVVQTSGKKLTVFPASSLDVNGDGKIDQDDVTGLQAKSLENGGMDALKTVSVLPFMGEPNTWLTDVEHQNVDANQSLWDIKATTAGQYERVRLNVRRARSTNGPSGTTVTAVKEGSLNIAEKFTGSYVKRNGWDQINQSPTWDTTVIDASTTPAGGYVNYDKMAACQTANETPGNTNWLWCGSLVLFGGALSTFDDTSSYNNYLNGWANYSYADADKGFMFEGRLESSSSGAPVMKWNQNVPLNIKVGTATPNEFSQVRDENWGNKYVHREETNKFTVTMERVIEDKLGNKLPVMIVSMEGSSTMTAYTDSTKTTLMSATDPSIVNDGMFNGKNPATDTRKGAFYIIAKYGVQFPAVKPDGTKIDFVDSFKKFARFGIVTPDKDYTVVAGDKLNSVCGITAGSYTAKQVFACETTSSTIGTTDLGTLSAIPVKDDATTATVRNSWIVAVAQHIDEIDRPRGQSKDAQAYVWVEHNSDGIGLEPKNWDPVTYQSYPLVGGGTKVFTTTLNPDGTDGETNADYYNIHFNPGTTPTANIKFVMELRTFDPTAANPYDPSFTGFDVALSGATPVEALADSLISASGATKDANGEYKIVMSASFTIPDVQKNGVADSYKQHWWFGEPDATGKNWTNYCSSNINVWLKMIDTANSNKVLMEQPIGWYMVRGSSAMASGDTCQ